MQALNDRPGIDGIVVQMPLPAGVDESKVTRAIAVHKDVDACHPANVANVYDGQRWSSVPGGTDGGNRDENVSIQDVKTIDFPCERNSWPRNVRLFVDGTLISISRRGEN